jgi:hypothetical protein
MSKGKVIGAALYTDNRAGETTLYCGQGCIRRLKPPSLQPPNIVLTGRPARRARARFRFCPARWRPHQPSKDIPCTHNAKTNPLLATTTVAPAFNARQSAPALAF